LYKTDQLPKEFPEYEEQHKKDEAPRKHFVLVKKFRWESALVGRHTHRNGHSGSQKHLKRLAQASSLVTVAGNFF
jgi:hypothetical protein